MKTEPFVRLGDVCEQDRRVVKPGDGTTLPYIGLESIEANTGSFQDGELSKTPDAPQANSFGFGPHHVLYGKLRPYLNKVALPDFEGKCSTEIIPLRPLEGLDRRYLAYFLRSPATVSRISARTAGARMPRADMDFVLDMEMRLPPVAEQRRIVDILSRAEGILRLRREAEKKAAELAPTIYSDLFGAYVSSPGRWPTKRIGELFAVKGGKRLPKGAPYSLAPTPYRYIRGTDIKPDHIDAAQLVHLSQEVQATISRYVVRGGDVVITIAGKIGVAAPVPSELDGANLTENAAMLQALGDTDVSPIFVSSTLNSRFVQSQIAALTGRVTIGKLALERIRLIELPVPPMKLQRVYEERVRLAHAVIVEQSSADKKAQETFTSLVAHYFSQG